MNAHALLSPRRPRRTTFRFVVLAVIGSFFGVGCHRLTYSTRAVGHEIFARIEGDTRSIETLPDHAVIRGGQGAVRIERDRVRIDDNPWTSIPGDADIFVTIDRHTVRVKAGRVTIERTTSE